MINEKLTPAPGLGLSDRDFAQVGIQALAFIKPSVMEGQVGFAIHAADGEPLAFAADFDSAQILVRQHNLEPLSVH